MPRHKKTKNQIIDKIKDLEAKRKAFNTQITYYRQLLREQGIITRKNKRKKIEGVAIHNRFTGELEEVIRKIGIPEANKIARSLFTSYLRDLKAKKNLK